MGLFNFLKSRQAPPTTMPVQSCMLNYRRLYSVFNNSAEDFRNAQPFPHIVIDNFLDEDIADLIISHFPKIDPRGWITRIAKSNSGRDAQQLKWDFALARKDLDYELSLHPAIRYLLLELNSITFLKGLRSLTGIGSLISDPKMWGGGLHQTKRGGLLRVHADFLKHPTYNFDRRLNLLLFLNPRWESEWHGGLELWSQDMKEKVVSIAPIANRCVIFSTSRHSYHGYTQPIQCPDNITRKSIAMYYYTVPIEADPDDITETYWQDLPGENN